MDFLVTLVVDFIGHLRKDIALDRFTSEAPPGMVIAPAWGLKPSAVQKMIDKELESASL